MFQDTDANRRGEIAQIPPPVAQDEAAFREEVMMRLDSLDKAVTIINEWLNGALEVVDKRIEAVEEVGFYLQVPLRPCTVQYCTRHQVQDLYF